MLEAGRARGRVVTDIRTATRAHYDRWSYDFETAEHAAMQLEDSLLGAALAALAEGGVVVDGGCGTGLVARLARRRTAARLVVGIDLSLGSLRRAHRGSPGVRLAQGDLLALPLRDGVADLVIARGVLMTTGDPAGALRELCRATRAGGALYVRVYNRHHPYRWIYRLGGPVCRSIAALPGGTAVLALAVLPFFWLGLQLAMLALRRKAVRVTPGLLWNLFADQLLVPHNSFHTIPEVEAWGRATGLEPVANETITLGQQIGVLFRKPPREQPDRASSLAR